MAAALTRQLLAFSRQQVIAPKILDLNGVVEDAAKLLRRLIGEDIEWLTVLDLALGQVKADPGQIDQVLMNLAVNSQDAMPRGGKLTIETSNVEMEQVNVALHPGLQPGRYVQLTVTDTGCGMDEATKARIFEPFFTTKEMGKGTGLGLAVVYGIIKQSGGFICIDSAPGCGTTFKVYLPRIEDAVAWKKSETGLSKSPGDSETLLLVEDEEAVRRLSSLTLQMKGYNVLEACNGAEALQLVEQYREPIHLLLTHMVMPQMSGLELADRLIVLYPGHGVLFLSGYTDDSVFRHGILEEEVAFLQKPFSMEGLACKVREVLANAGRSRLQGSMGGVTDVEACG